MRQQQRTPAAGQRGRGRGERHATAANIPSIAQDAAANHDVPLGLQQSPFASDGGALIGRDPRDLTQEELQALHPVRLVGLKAIREKCLDCAHAAAEVRKCTVVRCALWPLRMGEVPPGYRASSGPMGGGNANSDED
jgi:hypothetical protein